MIVSRMTTAVDLKLFNEVSKRIRLAIDAIRSRQRAQPATKKMPLRAPFRCLSWAAAGHANWPGLGGGSEPD